ncbi:tetratricopeptide repeat protein [Mucilaginibacter sp.]|uniref:tetratricopeptide repeat protein n=1 Tax=Mucilaginibacter sp. TaxID=1882438 RepID=UPI002ED5902A
MRGLIAKLCFAALLVCNTKGYAQYNSVKQIDSIIKVAEQINDTEQSIKLGIKASDCARKIKYEDGTIEGITLAALKSYNAGRNEDVLKYVTLAENAVPKITNPSYHTHLMTLKGMSYTNLGFYKQGRQILNAALPVASEIANADIRHYRLGYIYNALSDNNQQAKGDLNTTLLFSQKSYLEHIKVSKKSHFANGRVLATDNLGVSFFELKKYDSAEVYFNKAVLLADEYKDITVKAFANTDLGNLYYREQKYTQSKNYYYKAIPAAKEMGNGYQLKEIYTGLSKVYAALKDDKKARELLELSMKLTDSLNKAEKSAIKTPLNDILKTEDKKLAKNNTSLISVLAGVFILLVSAVCILIFFSGKFKKQLKVSEGKIEELSKMVVISTAQYSLECLKEIVELAMDNNPLFLAKFNELYPEFTEKLLSLAPNLIATEIELCILLRINFDTKEIARYTKTSVRSVEGKKHRIRKKLNIDSKADINLWIANV